MNYMSGRATMYLYVPDGSSISLDPSIARIKASCGDRLQSARRSLSETVRVRILTLIGMLIADWAAKLWWVRNHRRRGCAKTVQGCGCRTSHAIYWQDQLLTLSHVDSS